jgi:multiple sugar transport system ATP-binding protein
MAHVALKKVGKTYPGATKPVVQEVNLEIQKGEFIVLVGPSGCGKSTTLRMVAGLEDITAGTIEIAGRVVNNVAPKERDIAMVFQNYALYPHMSCFDNMAFALKLKGASKADIERKVKRTAETLGISHLLERKPGQLSGGQRQRVAVGRAMVREPAVYLFDEPLSNLDARLRVEMRAELKRMHATLQTTTIYVTHDQEEAMTLGDRVVVMSEGHVQQMASPLEVFERPANRFVAGFLGTPPMNFVEGHLLAGPRFDSKDVVVNFPEHYASRLASHRGQPVVLGVRPDDIEVHLDGAREGASSARVDLIEPLGTSMDVYLTTGTGQRLVVRMKAVRGLATGERVSFSIPAERSHLFEPGAHGKNLTLEERAQEAAA